jgi:hypothetical protein
MRRVGARVLASLAVLLALRAAEPAPWQGEAWELASQGRFLALLERADLESERPEAVEPGRAYLLGLALVRVHRFDEARPYVEAAKARGYGSPPGWETAHSLRLRIARCEILRPPLRCTYPDDAAPLIRLYAYPRAWSDEAAADLGALVAAARTVFPGRLPPTDVYLIPERKAFERFHASLFGVGTTHPRQSGAGRVNAVVLCEEDADGLSRFGVARRLLLPAGLLHEYAHSLCEARYGDLYLERVPQWLNEGLAEAIARIRYDPYPELSSEIVRRSYAERLAPTYEDLSIRMYEAGAAELWARYALARVMTARLLGIEGTGTIARLLDEARRDGDFERAMREVCGPTGSELRAFALRTLEIDEPAEPAPR